MSKSSNLYKCKLKSITGEDESLKDSWQSHIPKVAKCNKWATTPNSITKEQQNHSNPNDSINQLSGKNKPRI